MGTTQKQRKPKMPTAQESQHRSLESAFEADIRAMAQHHNWDGIEMAFGWYGGYLIRSGQCAS